jgi:tetratricopeptide (TPR) repeat protein
MYYAVVSGQQQVAGSVSSQGGGGGLQRNTYSAFIQARGSGRCVVACSKQQELSDESLQRKSVGAVSAAALCLATFLNASSPVLAADEPFLKRTGARGILQQEEEKLYRLRQSAEEEAREELAEVRSEFEEEAKKTYDGKLCATPFGVDVVGITEAIALTGALVGGISARRRKDELEKLNDQLRTINSQLRQQARAGTLYAPGLTYAPTSTQGGGGTRATPSATTVSIPTGAVNGMGGQVVKKNVTETPRTVNGAVSPSSSNNNDSKSTTTVSLASLDEEDLRPEIKQCQAALKEGKRLLKDQDAGPAMVRFEKALMLARSMGDKVRERRAVRGLAASNRILGRYQQAIDYLGKVLEISEETGDHVGDVDAYGTIADIYTEMGEFEKAAEYYDLYIGKMTIEGPV